MKKAILLLLVAATFTAANAQSLKDALYGGKLKTDSGSVLRKGDDLSSKIDSNRKKPLVEEKKIAGAVTMDSIKKWTTKADTTNKIPIDKTDALAVKKDNNKLWKEFMDTVISTLKSEVMASKKFKKGDYYVMVDYTIGVDGLVTIGNVFVSPENKTLETQVKERFNIDTPKLNPVLGSNGVPRKTVKRSNFTLTSD